MKSIVNFFASGFFRKLGQIFAWVVIGFLCVLLFNGKVKLPRTIQNIFGIETIYATSITPGTNSGWSGISCSCPVSGSCNTSCGGATSTGKINFGSSSSISNDTNLYKSNNLFYGTFKNGYTYTISFRTHFGGSNVQLGLIKNQVNSNSWKYWVAGYYDSNIDFSDTYIQSVSCSSKFDNTTSNGFITTCNIGLNHDVSRLRIENNYWFPPDAGAIYLPVYSPVTSLRVDFISIDEQQGVDATINNASNNIINNQNQNTQDIINNQNQNTQDTINSQRVCNIIDSSYIKSQNKKLNSDGSVSDSGAYGVTDFIKIGDELTYKSPFGNAYFCYYNSVKNLISCFQNSVTTTGKLSIPLNAVYFKATISNEYNSPQFINCNNGNSALYEQGERISGGVHDIQDTLNDTDTTNDITDAGDFINNYTINSDTPITNIIMLPVNFLSSLLNGTSTLDICTTWKGKNICLPNGKIIWGKSFPIIARFVAFFNLVVGGYILYKLLISIVLTIEKALDPTHNGIEVMRL